MNYARFILENRAFLAFGALLTALSSVGQTFVISLFGGELRAAFALSNADFGLLYGLATVASALSLVWVGRLVDTVDLRALTTGVLATAAVGCGLLAGSQGVVMLGLGFFLLRLSGQGMMVHVAQTTMARYFTANRGKAVSVAMLGLPLAEGVMPILVVTALALIGWRSSWAVLAIIVVIVMLPVALALLRYHDRRDVEPIPAMPSVHQAPPAASWRRRDVLRHPLFYALLPAVMAPPFIITALFFHQVPLAEEKGWSLHWLASSFFAFAASHIVSLMLAGPLVDRIGACHLVPVFLAPLMLGIVMLAVASGQWVAPVYLLLVGVSVGGAGTLMGALWAELYGTQHIGAIRALVHAVMVLATAASPVLAGALLDWGLNPSDIALLFAAYALSASLLAGVATRWEKRPFVRNPDN
ncbi:MFS transporter [Aquisalimonas sp.]|uniref:MFS transporter n=1 Tax=Aquisalimonas sp. TaxID=1872621 RepID=UPI0025C4C466|nr:MFS transporter [Aquisalimonas sp.]